MKQIYVFTRFVFDAVICTCCMLSGLAALVVVFLGNDGLNKLLG